jgi:hypothetical protein
MRGTDTALGFRGEAEWIIAGLKMLGIESEEEAYATFRRATDSEPGMVPDGILEVINRVCTSCVEQAEPNFPAPALLIAGADIPCVEQSGGAA